MAENEAHVVFSEEDEPGHYLALVLSGNFSDFLLEALDGFIARQRKRLSEEANHG